MTFVKTFEQFKTVEVTEAKDTPNIKKIDDEYAGLTLIRNAYIRGNSLLRDN
jgi:hypothetical protein